MKSYICLIVLILFISCQSSSKVVLEEKVEMNLEYGKVYYSLNKHDSIDYEKGGFILEVIPTKLEVEEINYSIKYFEEYTTDKYRVLISKEFGEIIFFDEKPNKCSYSISKQDSIKESYCFAYVKKPAQYKTFTIDDITENGISIYQSKVISKSYMIKKHVKKPPKQLNENQYYFTKGDWTEINEAYAKPSCHSNSIIKGLKIVLNNLGYSLEVNDDFDDKTKEAINDYQKRNGLKTDGLNAETLKKLGL